VLKHAQQTTTRYRVFDDSTGQRAFADWEVRTGHTAEVTNIVVDARRTGVGRRLLGEICRAARDDHGVKLVYAITRGSNRIARDFYQGCGWRLGAVLPEMYRDGDVTDDGILYMRGT
jgi:ribosomal protein S18 acetylase RimI-like enzyme